jgi:uncharacterized protein YdiU (UPF0061 family)
MAKPKSFDSLNFDNRFTDDLPADPILENQCRQVYGSLFSRVAPKIVSRPKLVVYSKDILHKLGLDPAYANSDEFAAIMSGNKLANGMDPYATCYGGHQFGHWAGQLGDGRAINLGEIINTEGNRWALQLKGAGPTPYSRQADGFAVLRSSVREYLCSEAMYHLRVPTTRALCLLETGEQIRRDMFYDGNAKYEPGAVVCRTAPSFTRFGHFQLLAAQNNMPLLKQFIDYTIRTDFSHLVADKREIDNALIVDWFTEVCTLTAEMIAHWMRVGFVHGVMNTDNMSILGLTIDYGPYGWLDDYDPDWTPNTTDAEHKRYRYGHQPSVAHWNLLQLAQSLAALTEEVEPLQAALAQYAEHFEKIWSKMMLAKLGIDATEGTREKALRETCLVLLQGAETDMTIFFRQLSQLPLERNLNDEEICATLQSAYYEPLTDSHLKCTADWLRDLIAYWQQAALSNAARVALMNQTNPLYVLRNYLAQLAIDKAETGDYSLIHELQTLLETPYTEQVGMEKYTEKRPDWARSRAGCSMLSCSS